MNAIAIHRFGGTDVLSHNERWLCAACAGFGWDRFCHCICPELFLYPSPLERRIFFRCGGGSSFCQ